MARLVILDRSGYRGRSATVLPWLPRRRGHWAFRPRATKRPTVCSRGPFGV